MSNVKLKEPGLVAEKQPWLLKATMHSVPFVICFQDGGWKGRAGDARQALCAP